MSTVFCLTHLSPVTKHLILPFGFMEPHPEREKDHVSVENSPPQTSQVGCTMKSSPILKQKRANIPLRLASLSPDTLKLGVAK